MRIQILPLPSVVKGDDVEEPFALIVDQWPHDLYQRSPHERTVDEEAWGSFAVNIGARGIIATQETVEIVDRYAEAPAPKIETGIRVGFPKVFDTDKGGELLDWRDVQRQASPVEYHWMITYIVATRTGFDFRQKSGLCQPGSRTRNEMFADLALKVADEDGLTVADFSVVYFGLEPNKLDRHAEPSPPPPEVHVGEMRIHTPEGFDPEKRSLMEDLPPEVRPLAAAVGIPDRPVDLRERAREWIVGFLAASDEDRVNCAALMLGAADDAIRCAVNHKDQG